MNVYILKEKPLRSIINELITHLIVGDIFGGLKAKALTKFETF